MEHWISVLNRSYSNVSSLRNFLSLSDEEERTLMNIQKKYPVFVNPYYLSLIDPQDPEDPIRKMCIPSKEELSFAGSLDTSGEMRNTVLPGLQHKYAQTALILSTNKCATYCRHCFRRRLVGIHEKESAIDLVKIAEYIRNHEEISNVLISGGDAFMNSNKRIKEFLSLLCDIPHIDLVRFGTRTPIVLPQRIIVDQELKQILSEGSEIKQLYVITQANHPREITSEASQAVNELLKLGIPVLNQAVLLKGVNDNPKVLASLMKDLTAIGVIPYYIFQCRPVTGVMNHFQVPLRRGYHIVASAMDEQNGLGKSLRFMMSHVTGKIEILGTGRSPHSMMFKYHEPAMSVDKNWIFEKPISEKQCWL